MVENYFACGARPTTTTNMAFVMM